MAGPTLMYIAGATLVALSFIVYYGGWILSADDELLRPLGAILSSLIGAAGAFLLWRGRQYAARARRKNIVAGAQSHVLYLRAFQTDRTVWRAITSSFHSIETPFLFSTEEEQLTDALRPFGDLIAIGQPDERLPTPGAARIYTSDEEWQYMVKRQMQAAELVVIRAAATGENVFWELTQAIEILNPQKLLILFMHMTLKDYESFRVRANSVLNVPLPESTQVHSASWRVGYTGIHAQSFSSYFKWAWYWHQLKSTFRGPWYRCVSGFIGFDADWNPIFLTLATPYFRSGSLKSHFNYALKPIFESRGLEWRRPRLSVLRLMPVVGLPAVLAVLAIFAVRFYLQDPAFSLRQDKDGFVRDMAEDCKLASATSRFPIRLCGCYAHELAKFVSAEEVKSLQNGLVLDSFQTKARDATRRCARSSWANAAAKAEAEVETKRRAAALVTQGNVADDAGEFDRAIASYDEAIRTYPESVIAFINRGIAYSRKLDFDTAIADYSKAIRLEPKNDARAFCNRGIAKERISKGSGTQDILEARQLDASTCR